MGHAARARVLFFIMSKILQTHLGHAVRACVWSFDGDFIVSCGFGSDFSGPGEIFLWNVTTGEKISQFKGHSGAVMGVAYHPYGDCIVSCSRDETCIIWDVTTESIILQLEGHSDYVLGVACEPNGDFIVSCSWDKTCIIWDATTGAMIRKLEGHSDCVNGVAYHPNGDYIVSCSRDKSCIIWDAMTGAMIRQLEGHSSNIMGVAYHPKGESLVSSDEEVSIIWNSATGAKIRQLEGNICYWSPSGQQIISAIDTTVIVWDATTGEKVLELHEPHPITSVAWSPEGHRFAAAGEEGQLRIWRAGVDRPLAVAMALHARLGRGSPLAALEPEVIRAIVLELPADWG